MSAIKIIVMATTRTTKKNDSYFVVTYREPRDNSIITLKVRSIRDSTLGLSFISLSDFFFETEGIVVVNPVEEQMRVRFENVRSLHLSIYSILSIEEVGTKTAPNKGPTLKFRKNRSNLVAFPTKNP
jgi:hypothetical protein